MKFGIVMFLAVFLAACVRTPTQDAHVVDDRPRISFDVSQLPQNPSNYSVAIDGIGFGSLAEYLQEKNALPVVSGSHKIEVSYQGEVIFTHQVYLGEGSRRVIKVVEYD